MEKTKRKQTKKMMMKTEQPQSSNLLTPQEAIVYISHSGIKVTYATLINWCKKRNLGVKIGGTWHIKKTEVEKMLEAIK